jgi:hypothetical protein
VADTTENSTQNGSIEDFVSSIIEPPVVESKQNDSQEDEPEETEEVAAEESADEETESEEVEASDDEEEESAQDEQDAEEAEASEEPVFTVKIDGTEKQVTLSELKRGYSGQEFVQKGMQEAARQRKQAEEVYAALLNERQNLAQMYQQMQSGGIATPPTPPTREMFESDPIGYMEAKLNYDEGMAKYQEQSMKMQQLMAQQSRAEQAARQAYIQRELESLKNVIPELQQPEQATKVRDQLLSAGQAYGYTPEEIGQAIDHRALHVLRDAMKYREIMSGKKAADAKAVAARQKVAPVKAGSKKVENVAVKQVQQQKAKLKKSGRIEDAIGLMFR